MKLVLAAVALVGMLVLVGSASAACPVPTPAPVQVPVMQWVSATTLNVTLPNGNQSITVKADTATPAPAPLLLSDGSGLQGVDHGGQFRLVRYPVDAGALCPVGPYRPAVVRSDQAVVRSFPTGDAILLHPRMGLVWNATSRVLHRVDWNGPDSLRDLNLRGIPGGIGAWSQQGERLYAWDTNGTVLRVEPTTGLVKPVTNASAWRVATQTWDGQRVILSGAGSAAHANAPNAHNATVVEVTGVPAAGKPRPQPWPDTPQGPLRTPGGAVVRTDDGLSLVPWDLGNSTKNATLEPGEHWSEVALPHAVDIVGKDGKTTRAVVPLALGISDSLGLKRVVLVDAKLHLTVHNLTRPAASASPSATAATASAQGASALSGAVVVLAAVAAAALARRGRTPGQT